MCIGHASRKLIVHLPWPTGLEVCSCFFFFFFFFKLADWSARTLPASSICSSSLRSEKSEKNLRSYYTCMRVGWKVQRLTMMQWLNLTKFYFSTVSPAVHILLPSVLECLNSCGIVFKLSSWSSKKSSTADITSSLVPILLPSLVLFCSCWGTENSQMVPNQENLKLYSAARVWLICSLGPLIFEQTRE